MLIIRNIMLGILVCFIHSSVFQGGVVSVASGVVAALRGAHLLTASGVAPLFNSSAVVEESHDLSLSATYINYLKVKQR